MLFVSYLKKIEIMKTKNIILIAILLITIQAEVFNISAQELTKEVPPFTKIMVGARIDLTIVDGEEYKLKAEFRDISSEKLNIQVKNNKLKLYLDDARIAEKNKTIKDGNRKRKVSIYDENVLVKVVLTCKQLESIVVRGEQIVDCEKPIETEQLKLKAYGEPNISFKLLKVDKLIARLYGESQVIIENGSVNTQKYVAYGEANVFLNEVENQSTKIRSYGENRFQVSGNNTIRIFSLGEGEFFHGGNAVIKKRFLLGENTIAKLD